MGGDTAAHTARMNLTKNHLDAEHPNRPDDTRAHAGAQPNPANIATKEHNREEFYHFGFTVCPQVLRL